VSGGKDLVAPREPVVAGLLSAVVPGAGQWYVRHFLRGWLLFIPAAALVVLAIVAARRGATYLVEVFVQPRYLWALLAVNGLFFALRFFAVFDAYRLAHSSGRSRRWLRGMAIGLLVAIVAAPHLLVAVYGVEAIDLLESVFVDDEVATAEAPPPIPVVAGVDDGLGPPPTIIEEPEAEPVVVTTLPDYSVRMEYLPDGLDEEGILATRRTFAPRDAPFYEAPFLPIAERVGTERITVLLAGGDAGPGRGGLRTDAIIVATFDPATSSAALIGLPRNFAQVPLPRRFANAFVEMQQKMQQRAADLAAEEAAAAAAAEAAAAGTGGGSGKGKATSTTTTTPTTAPVVPCHCFPEQINALFHPGS